MLEIGQNEEIAVAKIHRDKSTQFDKIPNDNQHRRYEKEVLTAQGTNKEMKPIRLERGKFELAPSVDNVTKEQANYMKKEIENSSKQNETRFKNFRKKK